MGFNGGEKDNEIKGIGNHIDLGERGVGTRIGRLNWRVDPLWRMYPETSPYVHAGNNPIYYIDKKGEHKYPADKMDEYNEKYPTITKYLSTQLEKDVAKSTRIQNAYLNANPSLTLETVKGVFKWGFGPTIEFVEAPGPPQMPSKGAAGFAPKDDRTMQLNAKYASYVERVLTSDASDKVKQTVFMRFYMTTIHETGHKLDKYVTRAGQSENGTDLYYHNSNGVTPDIEEGYKIEEYIWKTDNYTPFSNPKIEVLPGIQGIMSENYQPGITEEIIKNAEQTEEGKATLPTVPKP